MGGVCSFCRKPNKKCYCQDSSSGPGRIAYYIPANQRFAGNQSPGSGVCTVRCPNRGGYPQRGGFYQGGGFSQGGGRYGPQIVPCNAPSNKAHREPEPLKPERSFPSKERVVEHTYYGDVLSTESFATLPSTASMDSMSKKERKAAKKAEKKRREEEKRLRSESAKLEKRASKDKLRQEKREKKERKSQEKLEMKIRKSQEKLDKKRSRDQF